MIRIPYRLLKDSCEIRTYRCRGSFGDMIPESSEKLSHVHISLNDRHEESVHGRKDICCGSIYYDCARSLPEDAAFADGVCVSTAVIGGKEYRITDIKYHYANGRMHHIEMKLGGTE